MNLDRLQTLINILKRVKKKGGRFTLLRWQDTSKSIHPLKDNEEELRTCGTPACIAGWLAVSPEFKALGGRTCSLNGAPEINREDDDLCFPLRGVRAIQHFLETTNDKLVENICGISTLEFPHRCEQTWYGPPVDEVTLEQAIEKLTSLHDELKPSL